MKTPKFKVNQRVQVDSDFTGTIEIIIEPDDFCNEFTYSIRADDNKSSYRIPESLISPLSSN